jgi:hypothetical protein
MTVLVWLRSNTVLQHVFQPAALKYRMFKALLPQ